MPRATGVSSTVARYEDAWEAINRVLRRGGSWSGFERNCFYVQNDRHEFANVSAAFGLDAIEDGRGLAVWDYDRDGDPDLILKNRNGPQLRVWRNDFAGDAARLTVRLRGKAPNTQAIGARVTIEAGERSRFKEVTAGSGFLSQSSRRLFFGCGAASTVDRLTVRWPSGRTDVHEGLKADATYLLVEGDTGAKLCERRDVPGERVTNLQKNDPAIAAEDASPVKRAVWLLDPTPLPALVWRQPTGEPQPLETKPGAHLVTVWSPDCARCLGEFEARDNARREAETTASVEPPLQVTAVTALPSEGSIAAIAELERLAAHYRLPLRCLSGEDLSALGVFLEEIVRWPREVPVPTSLLLDGEGRVVRVYRGEVAWRQILEDVRRESADSQAGRSQAGRSQAGRSQAGRSQAGRRDRALPFPGEYYVTDIGRNYFQLGVTFQEMGLDRHAAAALHENLRRVPGEVDTLYNLGVISQRLGDDAGAMQYYRQALETRPLFVDARANLGVVLAHSGDLPKAEAAFQQVLAVRDDHVEAWINLGNVQIELGKPRQALEAYQSAAALDRESVAIQKKLGAAHRRLGDPQSARAAYLKAAELEPDDAELWSNLGVIEAEARDWESALERFQKAIRIDPRYASAYSNAGLVLQQLGQMRQAQEYFRQAIGQDPTLDAPYFNLVRLFHQGGRIDEARQVLRELLKLKPEHEQARFVLEQLGGE